MTDTMVEDGLQDVFNKSARLPPHLRDQLSHHHMVLLAEAYTEWAKEPRITPEKIAMLLEMAEGLRCLAWLVGTEWNPPPPPRSCLSRFLALQLEETP